VAEDSSPQEPAPQAQTPEEARAAAARRKLEAQERELAPKRSFWPIAVALALLITLVGVIVGPIMMIVGVVLLIGAIIGWMLEIR
jgi:fatty acid desaturase